MAWRRMLSFQDLLYYIPNETLEYRSYAIKTGDTLWEIANRYSTTVECYFECEFQVYYQIV